MSELTKRFVVRRATWIRGEKGAVLLSFEGRMCCLGFVCEQRGLDREMLQGLSEPDSLDWSPDTEARIRELVATEAPMDVDDALAGAVFANSKLTACAIDINDDQSLNDTQRDRRLTALFAKHGLTMEFVDE